MIFALVNSKGGVGKSTVAVHLAAWLQGAGRPPVLLDADAQGASSAWLKEAMSDIPVHRLQTPDEIIEQAPALAATASALVIDGPAGLSEVTRAILLVADVALLPCGPSVLDLRAVQEALRVVRQARQIRQGPPRTFVVPNKLRARERLTRELLAALPALEVPAVAGLSLRQAYADAAGQGTLVWRLGRGAEPAIRELNQFFQEVSAHENETNTE